MPEDNQSTSVTAEGQPIHVTQAADYTPAEVRRRQEQLHGVSRALRELVKIQKGRKRQRRARPNVLMPMVWEGVRRAANVVEGVPEAFTGIKTPPDVARAMQHRADELTGAKAALEGVTEEINAELGDLKEDGIDYVIQVLRQVKDTLSSKWAPPEIQARVLDASPDLLRLVDEQIRKANAKRAGTLASQQKDAEAGEQINWLEVTNKFLEGKQLRPADLARPSRSKGRKTTRATPRSEG